jgi:hypothetical protein
MLVLRGPLPRLAGRRACSRGDWHDTAFIQHAACLRRVTANRAVRAGQRRNAGSVGGHADPWAGSPCSGCSPSLGRQEPRHAACSAGRLCEMRCMPPLICVVGSWRAAGWPVSHQPWPCAWSAGDWAGCTARLAGGAVQHSRPCKSQCVIPFWRAQRMAEHGAAAFLCKLDVCMGGAMQAPARDARSRKG